MDRVLSPYRIALTLAVVSAFASVGCTPDGAGGLEALVFPREARLGSTAAIAVDSNYIQLIDNQEYYDLRKGRLRILLEDDFGVRVEANLRQVFDLGSPAWSRFAAGNPAALVAPRPGAWMTVALFDLPTSGLSFTGPPEVASVIVEIDGVEDTSRRGRIEITGSGGVPTEIAMLTSPGEADLESQPLLRLRAIRANAGSPGFQDSWVIGGIEFDVQWLVCMKAPKVHPDSDATGATALTGSVSPGEPWFNKTRVVLIDPEGFKLSRPNNAFGGSSPTAAGQGPFVTMVFDRTGGPVGCSEVSEPLFRVEHLYVTDLDGVALIDRRGLGDSTDLVDMIVVDTDSQL